MVVTPGLLGAFPILKPLPQAVLDHLAQRSSLRKFSRRSVVLSAGELEESVCFLFEGRLQGVDFTIDGREVGLYFVEPGDFCGELALFDEEPQAEFVIALASTVAVFVPARELREVVHKNPSIMNVLGIKLAKKVRQMTFQRSLLGLPNIGQRVCCQLWLLLSERSSQRAGKEDLMGRNDGHLRKSLGSGEKYQEIPNPPTHMEIAIMLNISRETVTRVFQTLQNRQIVRRAGAAKLIIQDPTALREFAEGKRNL